MDFVYNRTRYIKNRDTGNFTISESMLRQLSKNHSTDRVAFIDVKNDRNTLSGWLTVDECKNYYRMTNKHYKVLNGVKEKFVLIPIQSLRKVTE